MDTKLIENNVEEENIKSSKEVDLKKKFKIWLEDFNLRTRSTENFILLMLIISIPIFISILFFGRDINNYYVPNNLALIDAEQYRRERLIADAKEISGLIHKKKPYLETLRDREILDINQEALLEIQGVSSDIGVVVFDKVSNTAYSNKSWFYDLAYDFSDTDYILDILNNEENIIASRLDTSDEFEEIYFSRAELYNSEIKSIVLSIIISGFFSVIVLIILFKKFHMVKKLGWKLYKDSFRWGYLFKIYNAVLTLLKRNLIFEQFIKDKVVWIIIIFAVCFMALTSFFETMGINIFQDFYNDLRLVTIILVPIILVIHVGVKILYRYEAIEFIMSNLESIKKGDFNIEIRENDDPQIQRLGKGINDIRIGYKKSIEKGVASEKMKTELISNVSHDLKTPLTSIINYVNIIQREDITEQERKEYIDILDKKSNRLKNLIEDLFEVSKMNSGRVTLDKYDIDIVQLVHQSMGELSDYNTEKNMEFKISGVEELYLNVDGMRISRVFQNLATNALKYGLDNTRIYVEINDLKNYAEISFKNISAYELNFDEKDIVERFSRGDKSRNSDIEGSGLGLAIAKSIVEMHDGDFRIECEGDLFKAYVILPKK
ncbi:sensor histidine kinase [Clostridium mediterraneense]|uniref:sensor histidine kinase n=1 Tax=Clostridium mediterraneense TaxID=1805472 RepID=UPI000A6C0AD4|nr:HAMP domain-containing sensor histidine kinase [Clostridium mediterraneense]